MALPHVEEHSLHSLMVSGFTYTCFILLGKLISLSLIFVTVQLHSDLSKYYSVFAKQDKASLKISASFHDVDQAIIQNESQLYQATLLLLLTQLHTIVPFMCITHSGYCLYKVFVNYM